MEHSVRVCFATSVRVCFATSAAQATPSACTHPEALRPTMTFAAACGPPTCQQPCVGSYVFLILTRPLSKPGPPGLLRVVDPWPIARGALGQATVPHILCAQTQECCLRSFYNFQHISCTATCARGHAWAAPSPGAVSDIRPHARPACPTARPMRPPFPQRARRWSPPPHKPLPCAPDAMRFFKPPSAPALMHDPRQTRPLRPAPATARPSVPMVCTSS